jgi:hypothetical protein
MRELLKEMAKQVYPDGVAYEGSVAYHHLQAEIFLSTAIILQKNGFKLPEWYLKRLEKMLEFTRYYTRPDGNAPQVGDTDDGRLHILSRYGDWNKRDHRHLLSVGAVVFNRPDFRQGDEDEEAVLWLCGKGGVAKYRKMMSPAPSPSSLAFRSAGFYVLRKDALYMMVDCIQDDALAPRGHRHNSRLSFELYAYDKAFIVDPGTYTYVDGEGMRDLFRSTGYHNTVTVDGEEQNRFRQPRFVQDLFDMYNDARVMVREWASNEEYDFLDAEHSGYQRLEIPVRHRRQIWFDKVTPCWIIKDILSSQGKHDYVLALHFAPMELEIGRKPPQYVKTGSDGANIMVLFPASEREEISLAEGWVSPSYGVRHRAPVVHRALRGQSAVFYTVIYPYQREVGISKIMARVGSSSLLGGIGIRLGRTPSTRRKTKREAGE